MDEPFKTSYIRRSVTDFGPFCGCSEGDEKKRFASLHSCIGESNPLPGAGFRAVSCRSACGRMNLFKNTDGRKGVDIENNETPSVRGPPSLGLRARTIDVARDLMALRGSSHAYSFDCRWQICIGEKSK